MKQNDTSRVKRLGPSLKWTDADLDKLSQINPSDIAAAGVIWKENSPKGYEKLLEAKVEERT
ncbi:MAG: hypothetical protein J0I20_35805 [Chloroflexi bacterium]|nr:hypothetical protein [Chloroflexota bacterium]OJV86971.1 MAG: hypothetical protein BGO39_28625 [Chloroflexi bacterium 54-19]